MCGSRSLGAAAFPCLMALKGLCRARKIPKIHSYHPVFSTCLSQAPLPRQCRAREETALLVWSSCGTSGVTLLPVPVGQDAARPGGAALVGMLPTSHPLCLGLPTSARGNQKKRICTPQLAVVSTNRGTQRASSLLYVVLQFHSRFLPLLAASWLPSHTGISAAIGSARLG